MQRKEQSKHEQNLKEECRKEEQLPLPAALWQIDNVVFMFVRLSASISLMQFVP